jgi:hypothetical protein
MSSGVTWVGGCSRSDLANIIGNGGAAFRTEGLELDCRWWTISGLAWGQALQRTTEGGAIVNRLSLDLGVTFSF